jgi:ribose 5-phosphate isomerase B
VDSTEERPWRVVVGSDDAGEQLARLLADDLSHDARVASVTDAGFDPASGESYPDVAARAAHLVATGAADRALLVCGTGLGMAITANKVPGVRAVTAHDPFSVERSVLSNDAQVLCLGQRVVGPELARLLVRQWTGHRFDPASPSAAKVAAISAHERAALGTGTSTETPA